MGGASSSPKSVGNDTLEERLKKALPNYYTKPSLTENDLSVAWSIWNLVTSEEGTLPFREQKSLHPDSFDHANSLSWFFHEFYINLFALSPRVQNMFAKTDMKSLPKIIGGVILSALDAVKEGERLRSRLTDITALHSHKGVSSAQYGLFGSALFMTLELVIGAPFDAVARLAWVKVYCNMLDIILPISVKFEMGREAMQKALIKQQPSTMSRIWDIIPLHRAAANNNSSTDLMRQPSNKYVQRPSPSDMDMSEDV